MRKILLFSFLFFLLLGFFFFASPIKNKANAITCTYTSGTYSKLFTYSYPVSSCVSSGCITSTAAQDQCYAAGCTSCNQSPGKCTNTKSGGTCNSSSYGTGCPIYATGSCANSFCNGCDYYYNVSCTGSSSGPSNYCTYSSVSKNDSRCGANCPPVSTFCTPGNRQCLGSCSYQVCNSTGTAWGPTQSCPANSTCVFSSSLGASCQSSPGSCTTPTPTPTPTPAPVGPTPTPAPPPPSLPPPSCSGGVTASPTTVPSGTTSSLSAVGCTNTTTYTWNTTGPGTVSNTNSSTSTYTAPSSISSSTSVDVTVTVCNSVGSCVPYSTNITVTPLYTVSGYVFVDSNKNGTKDPGENCYSGSVGIILDSQSPVAYTSSPSCSNYSIQTPTQCHNVSVSPPQGYTITGWFGSDSTHPSMSGMSAGAYVCGSVVNFGITNSFPWVQTSGAGSIRADNGFSAGGLGGSSSSFNNPIPSTANLACSGGPYTSVTNSTSTTPGVIYTGAGSAYFGQGSASVTNWVAGGTLYPESFGPTGQGGIIKTSYRYLQTVAKQANITPVDLASFCGFQGLNNCTLSSTLPHGIYVANGNLTLTGTGTPASYTFPANQNYIILVNGDLNIQTKIYVPVGSTVIFSASGNINVDATVGEPYIGPPNYYSSAPDIEGIYSTDKNFIVQGQNNCAIGPDSKLNIAGNIIVNAALQGGKFQNQRDLCQNNQYCPVFTIASRPDFILNVPSFLKQANYTWQEVAP